MAEPASSTAGGVALWKGAVAVLGIGAIASGLSLLLLWPKTLQEAFARVMATLAGSSILGPVLAVIAYVKYPEWFAAAIQLHLQAGVPERIANFTGTLMMSAPFLFIGGLPFWWLLGWILRWLDKRKNEDGLEVAKEIASGVKSLLP